VNKTMKNNNLICFLFLLLVFAATNSFSQGAFSFSIGPAFPTGDFAHDDPWDEHAGLAGPGLGLQTNYLYQVPGSDLGLFAGADIFFNVASRDAGNAWEDYNSDADISLPKAINLPLSAGLTYILKADKKFSLYGKAGLSASFFKYTGLRVKESGYEEYAEEYDVSSALGYVLGAGISGDKMILEVSYRGLGEHKISGTWKEGSNSGNLEEAKKDIGLIAIALGWKFR
jgi:hypothetical protein